MKIPDEKRRKHKDIRDDFAGVELPGENELRIFCMFKDFKTNKWRLVQSDAVFSNDIGEGTYREMLNALRKLGQVHGELKDKRYTQEVK